ncbi:PorV/PorQ family protein, partial [candidate division KSB1 bacterium]|nr:PorV/PorQ family protein [candidate division KSB1 bacterium]
MKYIKMFVFIVILIIIAQPIHSQVGLSKVAQSTMNFQLVGISPKASAMGDAFMALGKGAESIFFNPAGLAEVSNNFDVKMYATQWIADINYMAGAAVWNANNYGAIGFSFLWVDYGTIYGTSLVPLAEQSLYPRGYIDNGTVSNVGAYSAGISYALAVSTKFLIGGNIRLVGQNLGQNYFPNGEVIDNNATKLVFDAGVKYYTGFKSFRFGMAIRNFSSNLKREEISEQLPLLFTMGAAMDIFDVVAPSYSEDNSLTLAIDFQHPNN